MKKSKDNVSYLILGCGVLFSALVLIFMAITGINYDVLIGKAQFTVYELLSYGDKTRIGLVFALIFVIIALVAAIAILIIKLIKAKVAFCGWIALGAAVLSLVAGILFFSTKGLIGESGNDLVTVAAGAVLCGIFALLNAFVLGFYAVTELKK